MMKLVADTMRDPDTHDPLGVAEAQAMLDTAYAWLDERLANRAWAAGADFSLADCAAAPSLFYADWVRPIPAAYATLQDYRARVLTRPSMARAVDEARPYRPLFPPGAPDRD
jgi:glutathione S-transferase